MTNCQLAFFWVVELKVQSNRQTHPVRIFCALLHQFVVAKTEALEYGFCGPFSDKFNTLNKLWMTRRRGWAFDSHTKRS